MNAVMQTRGSVKNSKVEGIVKETGQNRKQVKFDQNIGVRSIPRDNAFTLAGI